jgi:hypothetical protein
MMNMAYQIKYKIIGNEVRAYLAEIPTTCAYGKDEKEAFASLMLLLHGEREIPDGQKAQDEGN